MSSESSNAESRSDRDSAACAFVIRLWKNSELPHYWESAADPPIRMAGLRYQKHRALQDGYPLIGSLLRRIRIFWITIMEWAARVSPPFDQLMALSKVEGRRPFLIAVSYAQDKPTVN